MNKELQAIVELTEKRLSAIPEQENLELEQANAEMVKLQKELLSASLLSKPKLELQIKQKLKVAEAKYFSLADNSKPIQLAYLKKYIRERYD